MYHLVIFEILLVPLCLGQTIDQLISASAQSSHDTDVFYDSNTVLVEYDMLFSAKDWNEIQQMNRDDADTNRVKRNALRDLAKRWKSRIIPYSISGSFSSSDQAQVQAAINDYHSYTCLKFRPATSSDYNRISLQNGGGCASYVGMVGGQQVVTLAPGCRRKGIIIHELGHAIGFHHEQTRPDRDNYVTIISQNVIPHTLYNFQKYSKRVINTYGVPYDYRSIMHYGQYAFSRNGQPTIRTRDSSKQHLIGNRYDFSFRDVKLVNLMYQCDSHCTNKPTCPGQGFVDKDCKCKCPGNPVKDCKGTGTGGGGGGGGGSGGKDCEDNHRNCDSWAASGECTKNPGYMLVNCKASCRKCDGGGGGGGGGGGSTCVDTNTWCSYWAKSGYCRHWYYGDWMKAYCIKSCDLCDNTGYPTGGDDTDEDGDKTDGDGDETDEDGDETDTDSDETDTECKDEYDDCAAWAAAEECQKNPEYMLETCRASCKQCGGDDKGDGDGGGQPSSGLFGSHFGEVFQSTGCIILGELKSKCQKLKKTHFYQLFGPTSMIDTHNYVPCPALVLIFSPETIEQHKLIFCTTFHARLLDYLNGGTSYHNEQDMNENVQE